MAGAGFKDFAVGEVLTATDVDTYLMQQSVMRFADSAARGSALGTATGTAVPLAEGMVSYLDDVNTVQVYTGTGWTSPVAGVGANTASAVKTDTFTTSSATYVDITDLSVSITPRFATSKVLIIASVMFLNSGNNKTAAIQLVRDSTAIGIGDAASSRTRASAGYQSEDNVVHAQGPTSIVFLDSPATTSATTYKLQMLVDSGTGVVNRGKGDGDSASSFRTASSITVIEVAA